MFHNPAVNLVSIAGDEKLTAGNLVGCVLCFTESRIVELDNKRPSLLVGQQWKDHQVGMPTEIVITKRLIEVFYYFRFRRVFDLAFEVHPFSSEIEYRGIA